MARTSSRWFVLPLAACIAVSAWGCNPKIGDDCSTSTDCSVNGDRLCDTTQPGGYCTVFNCEPDTCPEEAQCIAFDTELDPSCEDQRWARFERTFCMRRCDNDGDCRSGYVYFNMNTDPNPWGARVADLDPEGTKVCVAPFSGSPPGGNLSEVCSPYDGGFPDAGTVVSPDADVADGPESDVESDVESDAPSDDAGTGDAGTDDAGDADAGTDDAGDADAGTDDAGDADAGTDDAGTDDAGTDDAGDADAA